MAEERNLAVARAVEDADGDDDATKAELQRRMEEARESITQTVTEIKDTVANQYQAVRQSVTEALDWREQYRKRPVVWSVGALSVGFIVGYSLGGAFTGDGEEQDYYPAYEEDYETSGRGSAGAAYSASEETPARASSQRSSSVHAPSYAAQAITGSDYGAFSRQGSSSAAPQGANEYGAETEAAEAEKPSLLERFKETRAYDRLQEEVSSLGDRFLDELSNVGQTVVLPILFSKIKDLFGVDLSNKRQGQSSSSGGGSSSGADRTGTSGASSGGSAPAPRREEDRSQTSGTASGSSGSSSYGTSENSRVGSSQ